MAGAPTEGYWEVGPGLPHECSLAESDEAALSSSFHEVGAQQRELDSVNETFLRLPLRAFLSKLCNNSPKFPTISSSQADNWVVSNGVSVDYGRRGGGGKQFQ